MKRKPFKYPFEEHERPNRIKYWREVREMTQEKLSEMLGTTRATINKYEVGRHPVTVERLREIAAVLGVSTADLLMPKDNPLALDADGLRIMEAWQDVPAEARPEVADALLQTLRLFGGKGPNPQKRHSRRA